MVLSTSGLSVMRRRTRVARGGKRDWRRAVFACMNDAEGGEDLLRGLDTTRGCRAKWKNACVARTILPPVPIAFPWVAWVVAQCVHASARETQARLAHVLAPPSIEPFRESTQHDVRGRRARCLLAPQSTLLDPSVNTDPARSTRTYHTRGPSSMGPNADVWRTDEAAVHAKWHRARFRGRRAPGRRRRLGCCHRADEPRRASGRGIKPKAGGLTRPIEQERAAVTGPVCGSSCTVSSRRGRRWRRPVMSLGRQDPRRTRDSGTAARERDVVGAAGDRQRRRARVLATGCVCGLSCTVSSHGRSCVSTGAVHVSQEPRRTSFVDGYGSWGASARAIDARELVRVL